MTVSMITIKTTSEHITKYVYTSGSSQIFFNSDFQDFQRTYGAENVSIEKAKGKKIIVVTQPIVSEAASRPFKTESF